MNRLTEKDSQWNWRLKGVPWESLYAGAMITEEVRQKLYEALHKLMDYEDTGLSPSEITNLTVFNATTAIRLLRTLDKEWSRELNKHRWIPVEERLPAEGEQTLITLDDGYVATTDYYNSEWELWPDSGDVIAWMPMPEPYRGGTP